MAKRLTLRLDEEQARELEVIARVDNVSLAGAIRLAIAAHVASRRKDRAFQKRLERAMAEDRAVVERLSAR